MPFCQSCRRGVRGERDAIGARCPYCREPLYERPYQPARATAPGAGICASHPGKPAVGTCERCGTFACAVCRTRWWGKLLCMNCLNRALETDEARPHEARTHTTQAIVALVLGIVSWALLVAGVVLSVIAVGTAMDQNKLNPGLLILAVGALFGSPLPALVGVGLGAAALRTRGNHLILGTFGLILNGLNIGAMIGLFAFAFWQQG
jgi:hypothetical protein